MVPRPCPDDGANEAILTDILTRGTSPHPAATARALIAEFGSLGAILAASPGRQMTVSANDRAAVDDLATFRRTMMHVLDADLRREPVLADGRALRDYLSATMAHAAAESVRVLYLNAQNRLIRDETPFTGTIDAVPLGAREIIKRALDLNAAGIILAHNHPSGDPTPSRKDIESTRSMIAAAELFGIVVHDHVVVGREGVVSLRALGLIGA